MEKEINEKDLKKMIQYISLLVGNEISKCETPAQIIDKMILLTIYFLKIFFIAYNVNKEDKEEVINEIKKKIDELKE